MYDPWFFVRIALEYDLGMARSYMAGEWDVPGDEKVNYDGLSNLFHLFINNRGPVGSMEGSKLNVKNMFTSWIGYTVNWLYLRVSMDNSLSGSKPNIEAHYDLSNKVTLDILINFYLIRFQGSS